MKSYFLDEFDNKKDYLNFIEYMLLNSDTFSLVYFKYSESEKVKNTVKEIKSLLSPYKKFMVNGNQWPGTVTLNTNKHIYKVALYQADLGAKEALFKANNIYDWHYPFFPMDLCFFKDGYAWFELCAHERMSYIYIDNKKTYSDLINIGAKLSYKADIDSSELFLEKQLKEKAEI